MASVNEKVTAIKAVIALSESSRTCEKARVPIVKAEALRQFKVCYSYCFLTSGISVMITYVGAL
jgi:hypothetical protein